MKTKAQLSTGQEFLAKINGDKTAGKFTPKKAIFSQGDEADSIFYIDN